MFKSKNIKITDFTLKSKQPFFKAQSISGKFQRRFTGIHFTKQNLPRITWLRILTK